MMGLRISHYFSCILLLNEMFELIVQIAFWFRLKGKLFDFLHHFVSQDLLDFMFVFNDFQRLLLGNWKFRVLPCNRVAYRGVARIVRVVGALTLRSIHRVLDFWVCSRMLMFYVEWKPVGDYFHIAFTHLLELSILKYSKLTEKNQTQSSDLVVKNNKYFGESLIPL